MEDNTIKLKTSSPDNDGDDGDAEMEDAGEKVGVVGDGDPPLFVSLKPTDLTDTDREIVRQLHPILYRLEPYSDTDELHKDIDGIEQLLSQSSSIVANAESDDQRTLKILLDQLATIFRNARNREAAKVPVHGDNVPFQYRIAAMEMRHAALYSKLHTIDDNSGMMVYAEGVADLQAPGKIGVVVIRQEDRLFWERCIDLISNDHPVCGVGNPGIGKTTTSIYLLQRLIHLNKSVVYTIRQRQGSDDFFYELIPIVDQHNGEVQDVAVKLYKMRHERVSEISVLKGGNSVYVVDPGDFASSCDVSKIVRPAQFIMNASNDESHWGESNFTKFRSAPKRAHWALEGDGGETAVTKAGKIIHGSLWTGHQLLVAKAYLLNQLEPLDDDELLRRFRIVGGSIRDIVEFDEDKFKEKVAAALNINDVTVQGLVDGNYQFLYKPAEPSSTLVGLGPADANLELIKIVLKSDYVEEQLGKRHLRISWYAFLNEDNAGNRGNVFESYLREKFSVAEIHFAEKEARESLRTKPIGPKQSRQKKNYVPVLGGMTIGSKRTIVRVSDMNARVQTDLAMEYMFYSKDQAEPLIDMILRVGGGYDAIQSTVGKKHGSATEKIKALKAELNLKDTETLRIFFAVPEDRYADFVTDTVNPLLDEPELLNVRIFHLSIGSDK
jgi:hypothetical protein